MSKLERFLSLSSVMVFALTLSLAVTGCGTPPAQQAVTDEQNGDSALAQGDDVTAVDDYRAALDQAQEAHKKDSSFDVTPYQQKLQAGIAAAAALAQKDADQAKDLANTDPFAAKTELDTAGKLAGSQYGNAPQVQTEINTVMAEPQMLPVRIAMKMDDVTDSINNWLFWTNYYQNSSDLTNFWSLSNYIEVQNRMADLEAMLDQWQQQGSQTASRGLAQLEEMRSTLTLWQQWQIIQAYSSGDANVYEAMNANYMIQFLSAHAQLRATLRGTNEINTYLLQQYWGVSSTGDGGYSYTGYSNTGDGGTGGTGTGNDNTGTGTGGTGTGNDNTGTGTGGSSTGNDNTSTGTGTSNTGSGTGTGGSSTGGSSTDNANSSTGTGTSNTGSGTGSTGSQSNTGSGATSTNSGTAVGDPFSDINR